MRSAAFLLVLLLSAAPGFAAEGGVTSAPLLQRPWGARAPGLAGAFAATRGSLEAAGYNPAGVAGLAGRRVNLLYNTGYSEINSGYAAYGQRLGPGTAALSVAYLSAGDVDIVYTGGTSETRNAQKDYLYQLTYAVELGAGLAVGASGKLMTSRLADEVSASAAAFDVGAHWKTPLERLELGAALTHLGGSYKYEVQEHDLPRTVRAGAAYLVPLRFLGRRDARFEKVSSDDFVGDFLYDVRFSADYIGLRGVDPEYALGLELLERTTSNEGRAGASFRAGYRVNRPFESLSFGFGLEYHSGFVFDYALGLTDELGSTHRLMLGLRF